MVGVTRPGGQVSWLADPRRSPSAFPSIDSGCRPKPASRDGAPRLQWRHRVGFSPTSRDRPETWSIQRRVWGGPSCGHEANTKLTKVTKTTKNSKVFLVVWWSSWSWTCSVFPRPSSKSDRALPRTSGRPRGYCREARRRRPALVRGWRAAVREPGYAGPRMAREPRARAASRRAHVLQFQHPSRSDQRLRRELPLLLVRAPAAWRCRARTRCRWKRPGTSCGSAPASPSPKSTSSTACTLTCRSSTTRSSCAGFKRIRPEIHLKCFTAVEIAFFADLYGRTDEQVLEELQAAGLDSLPGGGAEMFAERVRQKICHDKCGADRYLEIHRTAHRLGMRSNMTMLYGHIETLEERVDHMCARARCRTRPAACRRSSRSRSIRTTTRCASCRRRARSRRCASTRSRA